MKKAVLAAAAIALILVFPQAAVDGARNAMTVWYRSVAPVLFPFFVLMPMLTSAEACTAYERLFSRIMNRVFGLPGAAVPSLLISMLAGSPAGAIAIARVASAGKISGLDAGRMTMALCGLSPSFLILGIGQEMYGSVELGWRLAVIQFAVQVTILIMTRRMRLGENEGRITMVEFGVSGVRTAVENILAVCGYMVLFGAISAAIAGMVGRRFGNMLLLFTDLPGGSAALSRMEIKGKLTLQCAAIGFGGLCIAFQNMDVLKRVGVSWKHYLVGRGLAAALFVCVGNVLLKGDKTVSRNATGDVNIYALALFFASAIAIPWMYSFGKNIFLNKGKLENKTEN